MDIMVKNSLISFFSDKLPSKFKAEFRSLSFINFSNYTKILWLFSISVILSSVFSVAHLNYGCNYLFLLKITSIALIIAIVYFTEIKDVFFKKLLMLALFCHMIGDGMIEIFGNILYCIPFFMLGHILYSTIFTRDLVSGFSIHSQKMNFARWQYLVIFLLMNFSIIMANIILPHISGALFYGVIAYITVLALTAILVVFHPACLYSLGIGMLFYVISDCLIGYSSFVTPLYIREILSWPLYYMAQLLITYSLLVFHSNN